MITHYSILQLDYSITSIIVNYVKEISNMPSLMKYFGVRGTLCFGFCFVSLQNFPARCQEKLKHVCKMGSYWLSVDISYTTQPTLEVYKVHEGMLVPTQLRDQMCLYIYIYVPEGNNSSILCVTSGGVSQAGATSSGVCYAFHCSSGPIHVTEVFSLYKQERKQSAFTA